MWKEYPERGTIWAAYRGFPLEMLRARTVDRGAS